MPNRTEGKPETYTNPVYPHSFPDPFVLKFRGEYFAYSTDYAPDGNVFGVLRSYNLQDWQALGGAMKPIEPSPPYYWAPEVTYDNGKFYLYYSTGNETLMELRVAVSDTPEGGFLDAGVRLSREDFAIDAHVFIDDDGTRYLFYATDFLEHTHIGTGTVVDRMIDWFRLEGNPRPVTRAKFDWQVYDPARKEKGGVRWHTVEGPTILKRKGKYFEMFSGGNWQNTTYGVSFAVADKISLNDEWKQFSDGEKVLPILRTIPDVVVGPGHNSVVRGPNNRELYCVYHRWTDGGRVLAIDRMDFAGDRIFVAGPTTTPQPAPFRPAAISVTEPTGEWSRNGNEVISASGGRCTLKVDPPGGAFLCECTFRFTDASHGARFGFEIRSADSLATFIVNPEAGSVVAESKTGEAVRIVLPRTFDHAAFHLLRFEVGGGRVLVQIDDRSLSTDVALEGAAVELVFFVESGSVGLSALELTAGFEELFTSNELPSAFRVDGGHFEVSDRAVRLTAGGDGEVRMRFRVPYENFEIAANIASAGPETTSYGLILFESEGVEAGRLQLMPHKRTLVFQLWGQSREVRLPDAYTAGEFRQLRIVSIGKNLTACLDGIEATTLPRTGRVTDAAVTCDGNALAEMVRLTSI